MSLHRRRPNETRPRPERPDATCTRDEISAAMREGSEAARAGAQRGAPLRYIGRATLHAWFSGFDAVAGRGPAMERGPREIGPGPLYDRSIDD